MRARRADGGSDQQRARPRSASPQAGDRGREDPSRGRTRSAATKKTDPDRGFGEFGRNTATRSSQHDRFGPDPPGVAEMRQHDWVLRSLAEAEHARPRLLQILIARQLRQYSPSSPSTKRCAEWVWASRPRGNTEWRARGSPGSPRGRRGGETIGDERRRVSAPAHKFERLAETKASTTMGVRKRTPPRTVVPTKCDSVFIRASTAGSMSDGSILELLIGSNSTTSIAHRGPAPGVVYSPENNMRREVIAPPRGPDEAEY